MATVHAVTGCKKLALLLLLAVLIPFSYHKMLPLETCSRSEFALIGSYLRTVSEEIECNVTNSDGHSQVLSDRDSAENKVLMKNGSYVYQCSDNSVGNITVINARHSIVLCQQCDPHNLIVQINEILHWTILSELPCTLVKLIEANSGSVIGNFSNTTTTSIYHFQQSGIYQLTCNEDLLANITVLHNFLLPPNQHKRYKELIYTHGALMFLSFALIIPLGALLAHFKKPVVHMILQPLALVLACISFILAVVYKELNGEPHLNQLHNVVGLMLLTVAILVMPSLKIFVIAPITEKWRKIVSIWHKRLGLATIFFGLFNILLGLLVISAPVYYCIVYGLWVVSCIAIYVISGVFVKSSSKSLDEEESYLTSCCHYRGDQMTLTRQDSLGPMKLSKDLLSEGKYIQARKKSVDVLEMTNRENLERNNVPQRKISNVHFGPVAVATNLTPLGPMTPDIIVSPGAQFGFNNTTSPPEYCSDSESSKSSETSSDENDDDQNSDLDQNEPDKGIQFLPARKRRESQDSLRITRHSDRAHLKLSEVYQRSNSFTQDPSPLLISTNKENADIPEEEEKQSKEVSPDTPPDESFPKECPFHRSQFSHSSLPSRITSQTSLQQRRMRKNALPNQPVTDQLELPRVDQLELPRVDQLELPRNPSQRSISRNSSFRRRQQNLVDNTLKSVMSISDDAIICANASGEVVFWSAGAVKMFGYTPGEAIGSSLQMIMPQRFKEKHQNGINARTDRAIEYIKKHHTAPEEHKHARLYSVQGLSKAGKEFDVEVVVTSFVIEGEMYYTGIITEVKGLTRQLSASSLSSEIEIKERQQKALAIGAQMKVAHKLRSAEQISKRELTNILTTSLKSSQVQVVQEDITVMVDAIMKAGDAEESEVIKFADLIDLLAKHRLFISDSGLIAKYGKTKATADVNMKPRQRCCNKFTDFFLSNLSTLGWMSIYFILSVILVIAGVFTNDKKDWGMWSYGTGPVLSFNCVLVVLPMLRSFIHAMKNSSWLNKVIPLNRWLFFHLLIVAGMFFWTLVHVVTHFCSFTFDGKDENTTLAENFRSNIMSNLMPLITGALCIIILLVLSITSIKPLRSLCLFIGFYSIHWIGFTVFYILLIIHGIHYYNPSFWKWLLPVLVIYVFERIYNRWVVDRYTVKLLHAAPYDELSRTTKVEITKPKRYKFIPGQYLLLNIPRIGYFNWQMCRISSTNKEKTLTLFLPHCGSVWLEKLFTDFKQNPIKSKQTEEPKPHIDVSLTKPFGVGTDYIFDFKAAVLVCGESGPATCRSIIQKFLEYRRSSSRCGCHPALSKLYFVWITPSGNDNEWFTDFLSELTEDQHLSKYFDIRIFLTNIDSPPDELASALLHLALKTGGPALSVRRPSQPQLSKLHPNTSYGVPDLEALLDFVSMQQGTSTDQEAECGVFVAGNLPPRVHKDLFHYCKVCSNKKHLDTLEGINSPLRRGSSQVNSPEPTGPPQEWHITFIPQTLIL